MNGVIQIIKLFRPSFEGHLLSLGSVLLLLPFGLQIVAHGQLAGVNFKISTENPYEIAAMVIGSLLILIAVTLYWKNSNSSPDSVNKLGLLSKTLRKKNPSNLEIEEAYYKEYGRKTLSNIITCLNKGPGALQRFNDLRIAHGYIEISGDGLKYTVTNITTKKRIFVGMYFFFAVLALVSFVASLIVTPVEPRSLTLLIPLVLTFAWTAWLFLNISAGLYAAERLVKAKPPTSGSNNEPESTNSSDDEPLAA